jgi:membrane protease YdiL (CAAX protease family)
VATVTGSSVQPAPRDRRWLVVEIGLAYTLSVLATVVFYQLAQAGGFFREYLHTLVGAVFVGIPMLVLLPRRESFDDYGLPPQPIWKELLVVLVTALAIYPPFWVGFRLWWGWERTFDLTLPAGFASSALANLVVVALPEELFYRGYMLGRIDLLARRRVSLFGVEVGWSLLITSALFAVGHYVVTFDVQRLAVFFPALAFGVMRAWRGSITAAVVFHALCNIFMDILLLGYGIISPEEYFQ